MPCLPKLAAALALAAMAAWLVRNRPEQDPETYPVQPVDPWLLRKPWPGFPADWHVPGAPSMTAGPPMIVWHSTN